MKAMRWVLLTILFVGACDHRKDMETRTFALGRLSMDEAIALITPYIREGGNVSGKGNLVTVREKQDRITLIDELLKKYDGGGEALDVVLHMQVIEADGFTERDSAIADIEQTLRGMFRYRGYRLRKETQARVREDGRFSNSADGVRLGGALGRIQTTGNEQRVPLQIDLQVAPDAQLSSVVTATIGKPLVIGESVKNGAIILVIRASIPGT